MKSIFSKLASVLLLGLGLSNQGEANCDHFYVGGGVSTLVASDTLRLYRPNTGTFHTTQDSGNSFGGQLLVGYQHQFAYQQVLAAEAGLRGMIGRSSGERLNYNINTPRVSVPVSATLSLKPGLMVMQNNLLYGLVGAAVSKISMYQTYSNLHLNATYWRPGFLLGLGMQMPLNNCYSISLSYDYEWYSPIYKYFAGNNFTDKLQPREQVISLNIMETI